MRHANIDLNVFDEPEFSEASLTQVGIWLKLYAFCARKENGGIIQAAAAAAARKNAEKGGRPCKIISLPSSRS